MFLQVLRRSRPILQTVNARSCGPVYVRGLRSRPSRRPSSQPSSQSSEPISNNSESASSGAENNASSQSPSQTTPDVSSMLSQIDPAENQLLAPVHIPEDPNAVLRSDHPAADMLTQSGLVVTRQIEMMNIFLGFEQANRYVILDPQGNHLGYMAEHDGGIAKTMGRQWFRTHRAFTTHVFDRHAQEVLRFHRPFSWINSRIRVFDPLEVGKYVPKSDETAVSTNVKDTTIDGTHAVSQLPIEAMRIIGEAHSEWAPLRRKYNLFLAHELGDLSPKDRSPVAGAIGHEPIPADLSNRQQQQAQGQSFSQFAYVDEPFLSWDFSLKGANDKLIGSVNRSFRGFGREIFTDTGMYMLRMDSVALEDEAQRSHMVSQSHQGERAYADVLGAEQGATGMTLDQRALMLATAVTVDFDYFSRHSGGGGMMMPLWLGGGGGEAAGGAAGGAVGGAGTAAGEAGAAGAGVGVGALEGAGAGAIGTAGRAAGAAGAGEGAIAGAGSLAGYEAMQRGMGRGDAGDITPPPPSQPGSYNDPNSPQYGSDNTDTQSPQGGYDQPPPDGGNDVWGSGEQDPWQASDSGSTGGGGGGGGDEGGGWLSTLSDIFFGGD